VTTGKVARMRAVGARVMPAYGAIEIGSVGLGCPNGTEADHMHLASDVVGLITQPVALDGTGTTVHAFNLTSLEESSPKVMINYQIDDDGIVEERDCGCPLYRMGYRTSLHTVRSYSKLLVEGVTVIGADVQRILEEVLPAAFGGSPLDYQLVEDEGADSMSRLLLVVSPRLAIADEQEVARVFLRALRTGSPRGDSGGSIWERAGTLRVLRREPLVTSRGKQLPLHIRRGAPLA
jgi:phenylacetate-coenzyme A ligase PaaK-like adenylate-forming protein